MEKKGIKPGRIGAPAAQGGPGKKKPRRIVTREKGGLQEERKIEKTRERRPGGGAG